MLDWLKKLGGNKSFENKAGLDARSLQLLAEDFAPLDELAPDLGARVMRFVVDGEGEEVLTEIAVLKNAAEKMKLRCTQAFHLGDGTTPRSEFFKSVRCNSPHFFRRLGLAYEACTRQAQARLIGVFGDPTLDWLEILLREATELSVNVWPRRSRACPALTAELLEAMIKMQGCPCELLVRASFQPELRGFGGPALEPVFVGLDGLGQSAVRHRHALLAALDHADFKKRAYALSMMKKCQVPPGAFTDKLMELALASSKQVREQAEVLLAEIKPKARPLLENKIVAGENDERTAAARLLWRWEGENARAFLEKRLSEEKNKKAAQAIRDLLAASALKSMTSGAEADLPLPALDAIPAHLPLGSETERAWRESFAMFNSSISRVLASAPAKNRASCELKPISAETISKAFAGLQGGEVEPVLRGLFVGWNKEAIEPFKVFWQREELHPIHLVRFLIQVGRLRPDRKYDARIPSYGGWHESLIPDYCRTHPAAGLREFGAAFSAAGLEASQLGRGLLGLFFRREGEPIGMSRAQIWPYWTDHLDLLEQAFGRSNGGAMGRYYQQRARTNAFEVLACFPKPPAQLLPLLWDLALGPKSERPQAQRCLEGASNKLERLIAALTGGSAEGRVAAAEWLGRLGDKSITEALLSALKREKNEAAKGAMMSALELLGAPVDQFLDRDGLLKEAEKGVAKGAPEDLKWFPFDQMPAVHWQDTGKGVEPVIVQWWLIQGFRVKNPAPGALLRKYCASLNASAREALGQFVLEAWVAKDTSPLAGTEAEKEAMRRAQNAFAAAQKWAQWVQQNPQAAQRMGAYAPTQKTLQQHYEEFLQVVQRQPTSTAISSKGILSLAGACVGSNAAPVVNRYLKDWYGMRAAQCRALLQMLAWVEHKTATQLLLAVGSRFRTKGIQEEANTQAQALAERKGWTVAELADRTIPSAGMDENGVLTLDFGPRQFTAKLNEDLEFVLVDAEGKPLKSLPDPRKDDDEGKAAEAKKIFSAAKKELKSVVTMQRDRLYEAMCTQRTWPFEDWNVYLNRHPIARYHCQRLIWAVIRDEKVALLFRPLPDGSLTGAADDPVTLRPDDMVRVAHECQITPEQSQAWRQHLQDYNVEPLFEQFGRPSFELAEESEQESELTDFRGHILEAFKLRGRANKLGYTRGQAQDGGWFFDYHKRFPTLGMEAIIEFTGNGLPEENRTVALTALHFDRVAGEGEPGMGGAKLPLGEVPPVLLSECWNDIRQIAAEGPGFDADWEKRTQM
jgi:hypothetical protein